MDKEQKWHTGTPKEDGWYLTVLSFDEPTMPFVYHVETWSNKFGRWLNDDVVAWQKIEPFEAN